MRHLGYQLPCCSAHSSFWGFLEVLLLFIAVWWVLLLCFMQVLVLALVNMRIPFWVKTPVKLLAFA